MSVIGERLLRNAFPVHVCHALGLPHGVSCSASASPGTAATGPSIRSRPRRTALYRVLPVVRAHHDLGVCLRLGWFPINGFLTPELWRRVEYTGNDVFTILLATLVVAVVASFAVVFVARRQDERQVRAAIKWGGLAVIWVAFAIYWWTHDARTFAADLAHHAILPTVTLALVAFARRHAAHP